MEKIFGPAIVGALLLCLDLFICWVWTKVSTMSFDRALLIMILLNLAIARVKS